MCLHKDSMLVEHMFDRHSPRSFAKKLVVEQLFSSDDLQFRCLLDVRNIEH